MIIRVCVCVCLVGWSVCSANNSDASSSRYERHRLKRNVESEAIKCDELAAVSQESYVPDKEHQLNIKFSYAKNKSLLLIRGPCSAKYKTRCTFV